MTIDERIEKLTERHEALAQSVELFTHSVHEQGENIEKQGANIARILTVVEAQTTHIEAVFDALNILTQFADSHERRIQRIEDRPS